MTRKQEKQIKLLTNQCQGLLNELDAALRDRDEAIDEANSYRLTFEEMDKAHYRLKGWQDCAREMMAERRAADLEPFPSFAPGC